MPRLKNILQDKDRKVSVVTTSGSVVFKIPLGAETATMGHFVSQEIIDGVLILRYSVKTEAPAFLIEEVESFEIKFS
jgi:hypothetical protein